MTAVILIWGAAFSGIRVMVEVMSPAGLASARLLINALAFSALLPLVRSPKPQRMKGDLARIAIGGILANACYQLAINWGEQYVTAGVASLVVATMPIFVVVAAHFTLGERLNRGKVAGVALCFGGVALLVVASGNRFGARSALGVLVCCLAPIAWAGYTIAVKPIAHRYDGVRLNLMGAWFGWIATIPFGYDGLTQLRNLDLGSWGWLLYLGLGSSALCYLGYSWSLKHAPASAVAGFVFLVPVATIAWAVPILGELPSVLSLAAGAVVLAGVVVVQRSGTATPARTAA